MPPKTGPRAGDPVVAGTAARWRRAALPLDAGEHAAQGRHRGHDGKGGRRVPFPLMPARFADDRLGVQGRDRTGEAAPGLFMATPSRPAR